MNTPCAQDDAIHAMEKFIDVVSKWMILDRLMINDDKTEFLLVGTRQQFHKFDSCSIIVGNHRISPSPCVKNLGSQFDSNLSMTNHINKACNAAFYHLHNLRRIKKYLSRDCLTQYFDSCFYDQRFDYCNGLLFDFPKAQIAELKRVQDAAARLILGFGKFSLIPPPLKSYTGCRFLCVMIIRFYFWLLNVFMASHQIILVISLV